MNLITGTPIGVPVFGN
ncbi:Hypothetical protein SSCIU_02339 [Mammaliicoccus sciuri]|nr:Hypothetical protein SSCIU_02339 [Mammaliicoccus sciuri]